MVTLQIQVMINQCFKDFTKKQQQRNKFKIFSRKLNGLMKDDE